MNTRRSNSGEPIVKKSPVKKTEKPTQKPAKKAETAQPVPSKYKVDENGFIKPEEYSRLSNDELVAEYGRLKQFEVSNEDLRVLKLHDNNGNTSHIITINNNSQGSLKDAIIKELESRNLVLTRDFSKGTSSVPKYGYKTKPVEANVSPEVVPQVNSNGRKLIRGYGKEYIIDPSEYPKMSPDELINEYKKLVEDMSLSRYYPSLKMYSHNYSENLDQIEKILSQLAMQNGSSAYILPVRPLFW